MPEQNLPYKKEINKEDIQFLEPLSYRGPIRIIDSMAALRNFRRKPESREVIGFDTETKPSFTRGISHNCSLVQLAFEDEVVLFRLNRIGFPEGLKKILSFQMNLKVGIAIHDDIRHLLQIKKFKPASFVDLNVICPEIGFESIGARRLTALILGKKISKKQQVSNWESKNLTEAQLVYAATDAWICREIYLKLHKDGLVSRA